MVPNMVILSQSDVGSYCFARECEIQAPLAAGTKLLFVGHSPPPANQWKAVEQAGRNSTVIALESFLQAPAFAVQAAKMGVQIQSRCSAVNLQVANAIPVISVSSKTVGSYINQRGLLQYAADEAAIEENDKTIRNLVSDERVSLIILGCGNPKQSQSPFVRRIVHILRRFAEDRTILYCSIGHGLPAASFTKKYAGHPRPGHLRGIAAQPLSEFERYPLPAKRKSI